MKPTTHLSEARNSMDAPETEVLLVNTRSLSRAGRRRFNKRIRELIDMFKLEVFEVVDIAESIIEASGLEIAEGVRAATIGELKNECVKAVAAVIDQRLNYQIDKKVYRRIRK